ncbi:MAG: homocysteine S-methyltransferase family protein [Chloroflexi bacterium]|nr:homocysteine S-methyltransferase family protein [Chloroflexota bacterium]
MTATTRASTFLNALRSKPLLCDGAMGTMLEAAMGAGQPLASAVDYLVPEALNELAPQRVLAVHQAYVAAGAQVLETNSFGGNAIKLGAAGIVQDEWKLNERAARLAREAAGTATHEVWVAGSIGPTGTFLAPLGDLPFEQARDVFASQAAALAAGGADLLLIETMTDLEEARAALLGAKSASTLPVLVTLTFESHGRTMMGLTPEEAVRVLVDSGADAVGANCGLGPGAMLPVIERMHHTRPDVPLVAQANAGQPVLRNGRVFYDVGPEAFASAAPAFLEAGVRLLGSCCGSAPPYTATLSAVAVHRHCHHAT